jgi:DNA-binding response OmpR family regulator
MEHKILLVHSSTELRGRVRDKLEAAGFHIVLATETDGVLDIVLDQKPDVIMSEYENGGLEVCQTLVDNYDTKNIPIVLMTDARTECISAMIALKFGCIDFFTSELTSENIFKLRLYSGLSKVGSTCLELNKRLSREGIA